MLLKYKLSQDFCMSNREDRHSIEFHNQETIFEKRKATLDYNTPKITSSVSFNHLNDRNPRQASKSPFSHSNNLLPTSSVTPHPIPSKKIEVPKNRESIDDDLQNTWKKAPMISKKLPSAFGVPYHKSSSSIPKYVFKVLT